MVDKEKHEINGILIFQLKSLIHRLIVKKTQMPLQQQLL